MDRTPENKHQLFEAHRGGGSLASLQEAAQFYDDLGAPQHGDRWGPWVYDANRDLIKLGTVGYEIEKADLQDDLASWVWHLSKKSWNRYIDVPWVRPFVLAVGDLGWWRPPPSY